MTTAGMTPAAGRGDPGKHPALRAWEGQVARYGEANVLPFSDFRVRWARLHEQAMKPAGRGRRTPWRRNRM